MLRRTLLAALLWLASAGAAFATNCPSYPFTLINGTTADATQVMANFNNVLNCANTILAPLASPPFTGTPTAPTAAPGTSTTQLATTAFANAAAAAQGANPTATGGPVAVNGSATTYMRSDGAPAIQKASNAVFGLAEGDGVTLNLTGGIGVVSSTTVNGVTCTPGGSCTVAAAAGTLTGSTLASGVTTSSLTSFGTNPTINGNAILLTNLSNASGNAAICYTTSTSVVSFAGSCNVSDARLKHHWKFDVPGLDFVMAVKPGTFDWLDTGDSRARQVGLTAQDVEKLLPEAVSTGADRTITLPGGTKKTIHAVKSLDYAKLTLPLIVAVQQQQQEIADLKAEVAKLKSR